jgi:hypothetical protein
MVNRHNEEPFMHKYSFSSIRASTRGEPALTSTWGSAPTNTRHPGE